MTKPIENWVEQPCSHCGKPSGVKLNTRSDMYAGFKNGVISCPDCFSPEPIASDEMVAFLRKWTHFYFMHNGDHCAGPCFHSVQEYPCLKDNGCDKRIGWTTEDSLAERAIYRLITGKSK